MRIYIYITHTYMTHNYVCICICMKMCMYILIHIHVYEYKHINSQTGEFVRKSQLTRNFEYEPKVLRWLWSMTM